MLLLLELRRDNEVMNHHLHYTNHCITMENYDAYYLEYLVRNFGR